MAMAKLIGSTVPRAIQRGKSLKDVVKGGQVAPDEELDHTSLVLRATNNDAIHDLMKRFGEDVSLRADQRDKEVMELVQLDNLKRTLAIFTAQSRMIKEQRRVVQLMEGLAKTSLPPDEWESLNPEEASDAGHAAVLSVELLQAQELPRMDLVRACDPYAVMFVDGVVEGSGESVVRKSTWRRANRNPVWNEFFSWKTSKQTSTLTVTIWDKDNVTADDIVGCGYVDLSTIPMNGEWVTGWYKLENPQIGNKLKNAKVELRMKHTPFNSDAAAQEQFAKDAAAQQQPAKDDAANAKQDTALTPEQRDQSSKGAADFDSLLQELNGEEEAASQQGDVGARENAVLRAESVPDAHETP
eukprot:CAMPEP_0181332428 /NCGR_PEP_ID=MMETSP1101-20121128/25092_1 /TAXON_ID=46948 /ORGANISM="Rhodomonas abbreviata, Strain Caron Lab Isolate" /LENGTH=355 /DNA_ID=CAMNT_0023442079 /DNA_START=34 /DNA_END=1101 /DNA_ORIENTATION=-